MREYHMIMLYRCSKCNEVSFMHLEKGLEEECNEDLIKKVICHISQFRTE